MSCPKLSILLVNSPVNFSVLHPIFSELMFSPICSAILPAFSPKASASFDAFSPILLSFSSIFISLNLAESSSLISFILEPDGGTLPPSFSNASRSFTASSVVILPSLSILSINSFSSTTFPSYSFINLMASSEVISPL